MQLNVSAFTGLTLARAKALRKQQLDAKAIQVETSGFTWSGYTFPTDDRMQNKINAANALAVKNPILTLQMPLTDATWQSLSSSQVQTMADTVGQFIVACANNQASISASIDAATTIAAVKGVDIGAGWPANSA